MTNFQGRTGALILGACIFLGLAALGLILGKAALDIKKFERTVSQSGLGKIKQASQGQFSIRPRDTNNPHIKMVRVVSTVEYYLSD